MKKFISSILIDFGSEVIGMFNKNPGSEYSVAVVKAREKISELVETELEELYGGIRNTPEEGIELWNEAITEAIRKMKIVFS